ncbi:sugar MFS transporter [Granulicella sp. L60]|uniref:MFS transporter n=1 Tax=Granulicella sp. L60 TaxID=1641866 RepID=UPI00131B6EB9|nr:MFS transporter [Granulicella sp. L60]
MQQTLHASIPATYTRAYVVRALGPVFFYFLAAGIGTVMLGPLLPALMLRWHIHDSQAGTLFAASFLGQLCGAWFAARKLRASLLYGALLSAAGCIAMAWLNFGAAHIALFCIGLGLGAGLTAGNIITGTAIPSARATLLAILNVAWGLGAIACPLLVHLSLPVGEQRFFYWTAACLALSAVFSIAIPQSVQTGNTSAEAFVSSPGTRPSKTRLPLSSLALFAFASSMFLYVGIENALGGWLPSYAVRIHPTLHASSISFDFWSAELIGRLLVAGLMIVVTEKSLYRVCLIMLILTEVFICIITHLSAANMVTLTILAGLSLAPLYPLIISFLLSRTGNHARLGPLFASSSFGGATLPWLTGVFSTAFHGLRAGLVIPAAGAVCLFLLSRVITTDSATQPQP